MNNCECRQKLTAGVQHGRNTVNFSCIVLLVITTLLFIQPTYIQVNIYWNDGMV